MNVILNVTKYLRRGQNRPSSHFLTDVQMNMRKKIYVFITIKASLKGAKIQFSTMIFTSLGGHHSLSREQTCKIFINGTVPMISTSDFFHESISLKPLIIPLGPFRIFSKICKDILSSRCTTGVIDTIGKWKKFSIRKVSLFSWDTIG
jgi:hypothetical protein